MITGEAATAGVEVVASIEYGDAAYPADPFTVIVTGDEPVPEIDSLFLCPEGYGVSEDKSAIVDALGHIIDDPLGIDPGLVIAVNGSANFVVVAKYTDETFGIVDDTVATLSIDDENIATAANRTVTGVAEGEALLTAEGVDFKMTSANHGTITVEGSLS